VTRRRFVGQHSAEQARPLQSYRSGRACSAERRKHRERGFSLLEVVIAMGILAFLLTGVLASSGTTAQNSVEVFDLTTASQLVESVVLDLEEEYRVDGFPTNQLEGRKCEVPKGFERYECEYDLLMLEVGADNIGKMGSDANDNMSKSPLMSAFCAGGPNGDAPVDAETAMANLASQGVELPAAMGAFNALLIPGFRDICGINLERMCSNTAMISSFIPTIIEQAAASTRKLIVRLSWGTPGDPNTQLEIETFITSVPEAEETKP